MRLQGLRAFLAVVEQGSFSAAALELGLAQSSVSHAVAELEDELGVRLLERGRFGAAPTEVGERVAVHARRVSRTLEAIEQEVAGALTGRLRVSTFRSLAKHVLAPTLRALRVTQPAVRVEVEELASNWPDATASLREARVDLSLTLGGLAGDALFWELSRDRYVVVVPGSHRLGHVPIALEDLLGEQLILSDGPCSCAIRERLVEMDPAFGPAFEMAEDSTILALVAQGLGVAVMPALTVDVAPPGTRIVELAERIERVIGVALLPSSLKVPVVRAFLATLRRLFPDGEVPALDAPPSPSAARAAAAR